jgi:hypothetical protein
MQPCLRYLFRKTDIPVAVPCPFCRLRLPLDELPEPGSGLLQVGGIKTPVNQP